MDLQLISYGSKLIVSYRTTEGEVQRHAECTVNPELTCKLVFGMNP